MSITPPQPFLIPLSDWDFRESGNPDWLPATVPGCVHTDLLRENVIPDPFYRDNEASLQWIGEQDWEYRCRVRIRPSILTADRTELVFEGLDTFAEISINGEQVASTNNMFRIWRIPVDELLREGVNEIGVRFESPLVRGGSLLGRSGLALPAMNEHEDPKVSPYVRKAPYHFGWDWGPRLVTSGIWRNAFLRAWSGTIIRDARYIQRHLDDQRAEIDFEVTIECATTAKYEVEVSIKNTLPPSRQTVVAQSVGLQTVTISSTIENPRRWWPNGMGEQHLYKADVRLLHAGSTVDSRSLTFGVRTVQLDRSGDSARERFMFVINGRPLFCKGANWIPADSFPSRLQDCDYRHLLESAAEVGMNMVRIWGGGIYEADIFYDLCDRLGLLVWQDFIFSCAMYPADQEMLENIKMEARDNVRRLRNHPSLAIWCGNNEMEWGWEVWGWKRKYPGGVWENYETLFHELLPSVVKELDPDRPYWPSSPSSASVHDANTESHGDMHYWGVWHEALPFETYLQKVPRFMSEYGFQSFPLEKTVSSYTRPDDLDIDSPVMRAHQKHPNGNALIREYMRREYPVAADFRSFLYLSQVLQAEGLRIGAEHLRRQKPHCAGSLYWQLNDCWPVASWASIDYLGRWKALHYAARRFYVPLLLSLHEENGMLCATMVSDLSHDVAGSVTVQLLSFFGNTLLHEEHGFRVAADGVATIFMRSVADLIRDLNPSEHYVRVACATEEKDEIIARHFFASPKHLSLPKPEIAVGAVSNGETTTLTLATKSLARAVYLEHPICDGHFSDNFFDLDPGSEKTIEFSTQAGEVPDTIAMDLDVRSLVDAF